MSKSNLPPIGWRIFLSVVCIMGIYIISTMVALNLFGVKSMATLDGTDMTYEDRRGDKDLMHRITVSYHFYVHGKKYHNTVVYRSGETLIKLMGTSKHGNINIRYLRAFPYISNLEKQVRFERKSDFFYSLLAIVFLSYLFCFVNGIISSTQKKSKGVNSFGSRRITMAKLMENGHTEYDELTQEYYEQGWNKDDPSWKCDCGHWNDSLFCHSCGRKHINTPHP